MTYYLWLVLSEIASNFEDLVCKFRIDYIKLLL